MLQIITQKQHVVVMSSDHFQYNPNNFSTLTDALSQDPSQLQFCISKKNGPRRENYKFKLKTSTFFPKQKSLEGSIHIVKYLYVNHITLL